MAPIGASEKKFFIAASDDVQLDAICLLCRDNGGSKITTLNSQSQSASQFPLDQPHLRP